MKASLPRNEIEFLACRTRSQHHLGSRKEPFARGGTQSASCGTCTLGVGQNHSLAPTSSKIK